MLEFPSYWIQCQNRASNNFTLSALFNSEDVKYVFVAECVSLHVCVGAGGDVCRAGGGG